MPIAGRLTDRLGAGKIVPFGVVVAVLGTAGLHATGGRHVLLRCSAIALWVRGFGLGMTMMPSMAAAYQTLSRAAVPRATSMINIIRTVGGSLGTAVLTVVLERRIVANVPGATGDLGALGGAASRAEATPSRCPRRSARPSGWRARSDRPGADPRVLPPAPRRPPARRGDAASRSLRIPTKAYNL